MYQVKVSKHTAQTKVRYTPSQKKFLFCSLDSYIKQMVLKDLYTHLSTIKELSYHLQRKIQQKRVCLPYRALRAITKHNRYKIIEVNVTGDDIRYLLRGTDKFYCHVGNRIEQENLCIVVSTESQRIITAYLNAATDDHKGLNLKRYAN